MNLSEACDSLSHSLLIAQLNAYCVFILPWNLMASYVQDRKQHTKLGRTRAMTKEVPQRSILDPVLLNVCMNNQTDFI